jgi:hypothetical protein
MGFLLDNEVFFKIRSFSLYSKNYHTQIIPHLSEYYMGHSD